MYQMCIFYFNSFMHFKMVQPGKYFAEKARTETLKVGILTLQWRPLTFNWGRLLFGIEVVSLLLTMSVYMSAELCYAQDTSALNKKVWWAIISFARESLFQTWTCISWV